MNASKHDDHKPSTSSTYISWGWVDSTSASSASSTTLPSSSVVNTANASSPASSLKPPKKPAIDLFLPLRQWLDKIEVKDAKFAHWLCEKIPAQCPFERHVAFKGITLLYIPPLCKLNPVYDEVVGLRFRALCYLADVCGEDISEYC